MAATLTGEQPADPTLTALIGLAGRQLARDPDPTPLAPAWRTLPPLNCRPAKWEWQA